jgi:maltose O-acetyltransferase
MNVALLGLLDWFELRIPVLQRVRRATALARGRALLAGCEVGDHVLVHGALAGALQVERRGRIVVGSRCVFVGGPFPSTLHVERDGKLEIGRECYFNYGARFDVHHTVHLGERCMFGSYVRVSDAPRKPVIIGNDVWVAHGAVIQPGVTIGDGAVISAGSVVTTDVPAGMLAMGDPARMMSQRLTVPGGPHE